MKALHRRIERLELARRDDDDAPTWLAAADEEALLTALAAMPDGWRGNVYVGISPDDWNEP